MIWRKKESLSHSLATIALAALLLISLSTSPTYELETQVDSVDLIVYRDGLVHVTQALTVNETFPSVSFPLLAPSVDNVLVLDETQTLLDYEMDEPQITVFTLGATRVFLEYDTVSMTEKEAEVWTLILDNPYNLTVHIPEESTIVYLNELPTSIDTEDGKITLSLFPGDWEISYVLPITIPASFTISNLAVAPSEVEAGDEVTISATVTNVGGTEGSYSFALEINGVAEETKTVMLAAGASATVEFRVTKEDAGTYSVEVGELQSEFTVKEPPAPFPIEYLAAIAVIAVVGGAGGFIFLKRRPVRAERIVKERPELRQEDRDVIEFIAERGGKVLEAEIREAFPDLPRTTLWRLVRRLEKMDIVSVEKIGLQNQIELKK